jgi:hypothetical protein
MGRDIGCGAGPVKTGGGKKKAANAAAFQGQEHIPTLELDHVGAGQRDFVNERIGQNVIRGLVLISVITSSIAAQRKAELKLASWKRASSSSANNAIDAMLYSAGAKAPADFFRTMRTATSRRPKCRRRW